MSGLSLWPLLQYLLPMQKLCTILNIQHSQRCLCNNRESALVADLYNVPANSHHVAKDIQGELQAPTGNWAMYSWKQTEKGDERYSVICVLCQMQCKTNAKHKHGLVAGNAELLAFRHHIGKSQTALETGEVYWPIVSSCTLTAAWKAPRVDSCRLL